MTIYSSSVDASGNWTVSVPSSAPLAAGTYRRRVRQTLPNGTVSAWSDYVPLTIQALDADAQAYLGAFTTPPSQDYRDEVNAFVTGLKADGLWALAANGGIWDFAGETQQGALLDMRKPTRSATLYGTVAANTFAANLGFTGNGTDINIVPGTYAQNTAITGSNGCVCWIESVDKREAKPIFGDSQSGDGFYGITNGSATQGLYQRYAYGVSAGETEAAPQTSQGFSGLNRLDATGYSRWLREQEFNYTKAPGTFNSSRTIRWLAASSFSTRTIAFGGLFAGLTQAQKNALRARLTTFYARRAVPV